MKDLAATERCVKCGLCLPHCPTFVLTGNEADSPRGRISLMQMLDDTHSAPTEGLFRHLDRCLQCQACEAMCPSKVPFGELMDLSRARLEPYRRRSVLQRLRRAAGLGLLRSAPARKLARVALSAYTAVRLHRLLGATPGLPGNFRRMQAMLPRTRLRREPTGSGSGIKGRVNLFTGCTGELFDQATLRASRELLVKLGYRVHINAGQTCCGAVHLHNGDPQAAAALGADNLIAFADNADPIISFASGCAAHLRTYPDQPDKVNDFRTRVTEILQFLVRHGPPPRLAALPQKVAVHVPCTHRNGLQQQDDIVTVLRWIPGLEPVIINPQGGCCGAAGSYMLSQPELAGQLGARAAAAGAATGARMLLTTNIGCALQLRAATRALDGPVEIMHPVSLLNRQAGRD